MKLFKLLLCLAMVSCCSALSVKVEPGGGTNKGKRSGAILYLEGVYEGVCSWRKADLVPLLDTLFWIVGVIYLVVFLIDSKTVPLQYKVSELEKSISALETNVGNLLARAEPEVLDAIT